MSIRLAVRGLILKDDRLLVVNAYPDAKNDLWCAPGGGAEMHASLPDNLIREVYEETGLTVRVGAPVLINEFHDPDRPFHQVDVFFRCEIAQGILDADWQDPEGVVSKRRFVTRAELGQLRHRPEGLAEAAWGAGGITYDPLEPILR
jgi:8-oxo-dGTP pyrophosphatase MutT (NUDIX family)